VINLGDDDDDEDDTTVLFVNGLDAFVLILILILVVLFIGFTVSSLGDDDDDESVDGITVVGVVLLLLVRSGDHNLRNGWNGKDDKYDRRHT